MASKPTAALTAAGADLAIAIAKFTAFLFTQSPSMLSESIHSLVDAGNSSLLVFGLKRAAQPADETHPFGYGKELYFWTLIVALFIFLVGGGFSIYEGVKRLQHPEPLEHAVWNYVTLGISALFETYSLVVGLREFKEAERIPATLRSIHASKNPATFTVIFEDTAALVGLGIALVGNLLNQFLDLPVADAIASISIGSVLVLVALALIVESKALLVGEGVSVADLRAIREIAGSQPGIDSVGYPMTMYFGPDQVLLTMNVRFERSLLRDGIEQAIDRIENAIREQYPQIRHIYLEAESLQKDLRFDPNRLPPLPAAKNSD